MPRFFIDQPLEPGADCALPETVVRHVQVLRLQPGETLTLFNGQGGEYAAQLSDLGKRQATVRVMAFDPREAEPPYRLVLAQGVAGGDKMDWLIEKAVELGVDEVQPLLTEKCVVRLSGERALRRAAHWQALAQAACEQCARNRVPRISPLMALDTWLAGPARHCQLRVLLSPRARDGFDTLPATAPETPVALLIGPEGGLTESEEAAALAAGLRAIHLGARVLRTETAGIAMMSGLAARWGGWQTMN